MKTSASRLVSGVVLACLIVLALPTMGSSAPAPARSIVVFDDSGSSARAMASVKRLGGVEHKRLESLGAAAVVTFPSAKAAEAAARLEGVKRVEPDLVVHAHVKPAPAGEVLPWGVDRIDAETVWSTTTGDAVKVAVLDTGVYAHKDLAANLKGGVSTVAYTVSYNDDNGHGTHVAGTVAALDNTFGVVGVAPLVDLYAIKALDRQGSGYLSDIIDGLEWAVANDIDVVNMSLGTSTYSASFDSAVQQAIAAGTVVVASAGNSGPDTVGYPAKFAGVIAVGATASNDVIAAWSSTGPAVDVAAPGVSIYSTYLRGKYATMSGTSMAAPHVTGTVALVLTTAVGADDADGDGMWDPSEVEQRLERSASDLGAAGFDYVYGNGLVQADAAVSQ